jgi:integrase
VGIDGLTTHALRHGFVSWLIADLRLDPVRIARQVGHTSAALTLGTYAHEFERAQHAEELRERMAASEFGRVLDLS